MTPYQDLQTSYARAIARGDYEAALRVVHAAIDETSDIFALEGLEKIRLSLLPMQPKTRFTVAWPWKRGEAV